MKDLIARARAVHENPFRGYDATRDLIRDLADALEAVDGQEPVGAIRNEPHNLRYGVEWFIDNALPTDTELYARPVPAHLYCPNCYCTCCMNETRSNAK